MTGDEFKGMRLVLKLSQAKLGEALDMTRQTIIDYEKKGPPRMAALAINELARLKAARKG